MRFSVRKRDPGVSLALRNRTTATQRRPFPMPYAMLREFTDTKGTFWRVWDVYPSERGKAGSSDREVATAELKGRFRSAELAEGWLCFESPSERRRLAPIPPEWELCEIGALEAMAERAGFSSQRTSDPTGRASLSTDASESR
jgi:hypothetical protein